MQLDADTEKRIRARAAELGDDPDEAVAEAERVLAEGPTRPPLERLQPYLAFIKVRELREHWFGLTEPMEGDDLSCRTFLSQHGEPSTPRPPAPPREGEGDGRDDDETPPEDA